MMNSLLSPNITVTPEGNEIPFDENADDATHYLKIEMNECNDYVYLKFSSQIALYDFARELLRVSIFSVGSQVEFKSQKVEGFLENLNGVRVSEDSPRLFVAYPPKSK